MIWIISYIIPVSLVILLYKSRGSLDRKACTRELSSVWKDASYQGYPQEFRFFGAGSSSILGLNSIEFRNWNNEKQGQHVLNNLKTKELFKLKDKNYTLLRHPPESLFGKRVIELVDSENDNKVLCKCITGATIFSSSTYITQNGSQISLNYPRLYCFLRTGKIKIHIDNREIGFIVLKKRILGMFVSEKLELTPKALIISRVYQSLFCE